MVCSNEVFYLWKGHISIFLSFLFNGYAKLSICLAILAVESACYHFLPPLDLQLCNFCQKRQSSGRYMDLSLKSGYILVHMHHIYFLRLRQGICKHSIISKVLKQHVAQEENYSYMGKNDWGLVGLIQLFPQLICPCFVCSIRWRDGDFCPNPSDLQFN